MNYVRLEKTDGTKIIVNLDNVCYFEQIETGVKVHFNDDKMYLVIRIRYKDIERLIGYNDGIIEMTEPED